jgi:hypothetical protein
VRKLVAASAWISYLCSQGGRRGYQASLLLSLASDTLFFLEPSTLLGEMDRNWTRDVRIMKCVCSNGLQSKLTYVCTRDLCLLQSPCPLSDFLWTTSSYAPTVQQTIPNVNDLVCRQKISKQCMATDILWPMRCRAFSPFW